LISSRMGLDALVYIMTTIHSRPHSRANVDEHLTEDKHDQVKVLEVRVVECPEFSKSISRSEEEGTSCVQPNQLPSFIAASSR
jgi:hypothetical protein